MSNGPESPNHACSYGVVTLELFGRDITGISVRGAVELLSSHSPRHTKNVYGYDFPDLGINTFNNDLESEDQPVECFGIEAKPQHEVA